METNLRTYSELKELPTFKERFRYLKLNGKVGEDTFGYSRFLNQIFYQSKEWKSIRDYVIARDDGCDLGVSGYQLYDSILIHHMNPITLKDIEERSRFLLDPEYLISTCFATHTALHFGSEDILSTDPVIRTKNDTCPWRKQ